MMRALRPLSLAVSLAALAQACADLPTLSAGTCGNGVVDPGEDCDTFAPTGLTCRAPGAPLACRFDCAHDASSPKAHACPTGWGCGSDTICRSPSGRYTATGEIVESGSQKLSSADVDGDGLADIVGTSPGDLLGRSSARVHFFDHVGRLAKTSTIPALLAGSTVGDVNGDGLADVVGVVGFFEGIETFAGQRNRTPSPSAYPTLTVPQGSTIHAIALDVLKDAMHRGDETLVFSTFLDMKSGMSFNVLAATTDVTQPLLILDRPADALAGKVAFGPFVDNAPCEQIVIAFSGATNVQVFSPCRVDPLGAVVYNGVGKNGVPGVPPAVVSLPAGDAIGAGALIADVDADAHLDLVIDAGDHALVAYGDGKGGFFPKPSSTAQPLNAGPLALPPDAGTVVAFGRGVAGSARYLVSRRAIYLAPSPKNPLCAGSPGDIGASCPIEVNFGAPWTEAVVADLNRDGLTDVVAASSSSNNLAYYNGSPGGLLNPSTISTLGTVSQLTLGDFDGDLVNDVAYAEAGAHGGGQAIGDALQILFGRASGPPDPPLFVGRFDRIDELISANIASPTLKAANDLGVTYRPEDGSEQSVAVLTGNGDRVLLAPFGLEIIAPPQTNLQAKPIATTLGQVAGEARLDAIAIAADFEDPTKPVNKFRFWITESQKRGRFATPIASAILPKSLHPLAASGRQVVFLRAGDLDGDGFDEIVYVGLDVTSSGQSVMLIASTGGTNAITLGAPVQLPRYAPPSGHVALSDVDADGHLDLVMLTRTNTSASDIALDATEVSIFWGVAGGFDLASPTSITSPGGDALLDLALLTHGGGRDVAFASESSTWVAVRDGRSFTIVDLSITGGTGLAAGDVDGDGVEDLAVVSNGAIRIFRGEPVKP